MKKSILLIVIIFMTIKIQAQEWQWMTEISSVISGETNDHPHAFLWIPSNCKHVRGVVVGQHNMLEEGILEHADFRKTMTQLGFAEIWITPGLDVTFDFNKNVGKYFDEMMQSLANVSGYSELATAPIVPMGHSALASYPWNFAAWNPERTLAVISVHGDSPLTKLTGSGKTNPDWGNRTIEGVPSLFVMGEFEWWEARIAPGFDYVSKYPKTPITFFADAGHGHFDFSDELVDYLAMYISKAAKYRLPVETIIDKPVVLKPISPANGWLMDRWHKDSLATAAATLYAFYKGKMGSASWCFDKEQTVLTEAYYARARGKKKQYLGFVQDGKIVNPDKSFANYNLKFSPMADGVTFHLKGIYTDSTRVQLVDAHPLKNVTVSRICGPVKKINDTIFQVSFYRMGFNNPKRTNDIWMLASSKGDAVYKSAVQQLDMRIPLVNKEGKEQHINFPKIPDQKSTSKVIQLKATSDINMAVYYYIQQGPAEIKGDQLIFTGIPPRSKFPIKVTVVAWQYGRSIEPKVKTAESVEQSFMIYK